MIIPTLNTKYPDEMIEEVDIEIPPLTDSQIDELMGCVRHAFDRDNNVALSNKRKHNKYKSKKQQVLKRPFRFRITPATWKRISKRTNTYIKRYIKNLRRNRYASRRHTKT